MDQRLTYSSNGDTHYLHDWEVEEEEVARPGYKAHSFCAAHRIAVDG